MGIAEIALVAICATWLAGLFTGGFLLARRLLRRKNV